MQHLIKKQIIELHIDKSLNAFNIQHLVSQHFWKNIVPDLEEAFDILSDEMIIVHLDKLEIDLGIITAKNIEECHWAPAIVGEVSDQIRKKLSQPPDKSSKVKEKISLSICRQWMSYIQNGFLPWETISINDQWFTSVLQALATEYFAITELKKLILSSPHVARRIVLQHEEKFLIDLCSIMTSKTVGKSSLIMDELRELVRNTSHSTDSNPAKKRVKNEILKVILEFASPQTNATQERVPKDQLTDGEEKTSTEEQKTFVKLRILKDDGVFISNAGIILLHPFLNQFFKRQKLIDAGAFISPEDKKKAIFLLHFLSTGDTQADEHQLVVPKILCDFPVEEPIEKAFDLSQTEITEAMDLLTAAIQQWDILKETSIEGLRVSFLQRNGKLLLKKEQLVLQVEASSIDLLLDHLPWNLSIIKLPWVKEILRVEWR